MCYCYGKQGFYELKRSQIKIFGGRTLKTEYFYVEYFNGQTWTRCPDPFSTESDCRTFIDCFRSHFEVMFRIVHNDSFIYLPPEGENL